MSKVDWSLAPAAATHAGTFKDLFTCWYWLDDRSQWRYASDLSDTWEKVIANKPIADLVERPKTKQWSGPQDGLPPVGTICEVENPLEHGEWCKVKILAWDAECAVFQAGTDYPYLYDGGGIEGFRPFRTPEQQRETAIREIMDIANVDCRVTAARLVDAGFKREVV